MKTYVFIARRISEIGGAEQYLYNKAKYLETQGWRVLVFSSRAGRILIKWFKRYEKDIYPALSYAPECYSKREVQKTIDSIVDKVGNCGGDTCIIESDSVNRAIWAELIAERIGAKHLAFILQEQHDYDADVQAFLRFKYNRHELAGIVNRSVQQMLGDVEQRPDTRIRAFCRNSVDDCEDTISGMLNEHADYSFGSIGRLEKPCVQTILKGFGEYFSLHPEENFNLVLIGGAAAEKKIQQIREQMHRNSNVNLVITGNLYPIPISLVNHIDVFVSTAGSANVSYFCKRPTVRVHPVSGEPVGIIGLDIEKDKSMYDSDQGMTVAECIERAIQNADKIQYTHSTDESFNSSMHEEFERQLKIGESEKSKTYYDQKRLMHIKTTHVKNHFLHWLSGHLIGGSGHELLRRLKKRVSR